MKSSVSLLFAVVLGLSLSVSVSGCGGEAQSKPNLEPVVRPVKIHTVAAQGGAPVHEYPGSVAASESATLAFESPGRVVEIAVTDGASVQRGQLIARVDPENAQSRLRAARANRDAAASAYERAKTLYERDVVPLQQLEARRRAFEVAASEVETAREALAETRITAPFAGQIAQTHVEVNEAIGAQKPVAVLQDVSRLEVVVDVPEQDQLRRTLQSEPLSVSLAMLPERRFPATLVEMATTADPATRTYAATFAFDAPDDADVLPGMTARVRVGAAALPDAATGDAPRMRGAATVTVPASAVFASERGTPSVWIVDPATMQVTARTVDVGPLRDTQVTIRDGLQPGDRIAATGVHQLTDGQQVRPFAP